MSTALFNSPVLRPTRVRFVSILKPPFKHLKPKDRPEVTVEEVEVPTDKKGLIEYLNELVG